MYSRISDMIGYLGASRTDQNATAIYETPDKWSTYHDEGDVVTTYFHLNNARLPAKYMVTRQILMNVSVMH